MQRASRFRSSGGIVAAASSVTVKILPPPRRAFLAGAGRLASSPHTMRIVHVITRLIVGGAQENTLLSCEGQHNRGHDVTLITGPAIGPEGSLMERAQRYGYRVETINEMRRSILPIKDLRTYRWLIKRFCELKPDVVHTHSS